MNIENKNQLPDNAEWKAPPEGFEAFTAPEIPEDGSEYKSEEPEAGETIKHIIKDAEGRKIFERQTSPTSDWQKNMGYDEQGRLSEMESQKLTPGQESHTMDTFEYDEETGAATKTGRIEFGEDSGHEYKELPIVEKDLGDGRVIKTVTTEISEQGENGSGKKAEAGTVFTKEIYMEKGDWVGKKVTSSDGTETTQFLAGIEKLPNWE